MKTWWTLLLCVVLAACASEPPAVPQPGHLLRDELFAAPSKRIDVDEVFALSDDMRRYLKTEAAGLLRSEGYQRGLIAVLSSRSHLKLEYDATMTRNAAQAFDARSGNCLSLVIMTAAFAKALGLPVQFQSVFVEDTWSRKGGIYFWNGHVNLTLGKRLIDSGTGTNANQPLTIDFLPAQDIRGQRTRPISEETIVAMYLNNRAAEALAEGQLDDAYWWAREAIVHAPRFLSAYNTLGVVYLRHGNVPQAEQTFRRVLELEPANISALSNLALALGKQGQTAESDRLYRKLAEVEPYPPFHFFNLGLAAMQSGDFRAARDLFTKEIDRAAYQDEFHFWLGLAHYRLGDLKAARKHLTIAVDNSTTRSDRELYAAKLDRIRSATQQMR